MAYGQDDQAYWLMNNFLKKLYDVIESIEIPFNEKTILDFIKIEKRWPLRYPWNQNSVEIINNLGYNTNEGLFKSNGYLNYDAWQEYYNLGYTTILSNILDLTPELRHLNKTLKKIIGNEINSNFYLSKSGSDNKPSFESHSHPYDVIVKQLYGSAHWEINNKQLVLNKSETLIIPKNTNHRVFLITEPKLSLTINIE